MTRRRDAGEPRAVAARVPADLVHLAGRVAFVAGGCGGIGRAVAELLAAAGAEVVCADVTEEGAPAGARVLVADLSDAREVPAAFEAVEQAHGRLDVLVHCAGITRDRVLWKLDPDDWDAVLAANLRSAFLTLRSAVPLMRATGGGSVVLVTSINGERGKFGQSNYAASKAGLIGLGRTAARELGSFGIRVNLVAPGMIRTPMTAGLSDEMVRIARDESVLGRIGEPEDVARAILFLASDLSAHVTGQVLRVDGGQLIA